MTTSTHPSMSASRVSSRVSALCWASVTEMANTPPERARSIDSGSEGSTLPAARAMAAGSMAISALYASTARSRSPDSHGTEAKRRRWAASRTAMNWRTSVKSMSRPSLNTAMLWGSSAVVRAGARGTPTS